MGADEITRKEFNNSIGRLHEEVKQIRDCSLSVKKDAEYMKDAAEKMHQVLFGNGQAGLITKVSNLFTILKMHQGIMLIILGGLLTTAYFVIRKSLME